MRRRWLNITLVAILAALGLIAWLVPAHETGAHKTTITALSAADIHTIRIAQPNEPTAVYTRDGGHWRMTQPIKARADQTAIQAWLNSVNETATGHYAIKQRRLKQFGLKHPKLTLSLNDQTFQFGTLAPLNHERYIRHNNQLFLVNDILFYQLRGDPLAHLSKRLLPKGATITAITLAHAALTRTKSGQWRITPKQPNVSADSIQKLLDHWTRARATATATARAHNTTEHITIQIKGRATPIRYDVHRSKTTPTLVRSATGVQYTLPRQSGRKLLQLGTAATPSS